MSDVANPSLDPAAPPPPADRGRIPPWLAPNVLSLDAPLIAMVWLWFFASCDGISFRWPHYVALFGVVWCVYVFDRLLDVWRSPAMPSETARHRFYRRWWRLVIPVLVLVAAATLAVILFRIPMVLVLAGVTASGLVWLYIALNIGRRDRLLGTLALAMMGVTVAYSISQTPVHPMIRYGITFLAMVIVLLASQDPSAFVNSLLPKELVCGVAFAVGVALPVYIYSSNGWKDLFGSPAFYLFASLCTLNCLAISCVEVDADHDSETPALPQRVPRVDAVFPVLLVCLIGWALWEARSSGTPDWPIAVCVAASGTLLGVVWFARDKVSKDAFRVLADVVLLTPLLFASRIL